MKDESAFFTELFILPKADHKGTEIPAFPPQFNGLIILTDTQANAYKERAEHMLNNILKSIDKNPAETLVMGENSLLNMMAYVGNEAISHIILFLDQDQLTVNFNTTPFKWILFDQTKVLCACSLEQLQTDQTQKKHLWDTLKKEFN